MLDGTVCEEIQSDDEDSELELQPKTKPKSSESPLDRPIRYEVFDPDIPLVAMLQKQFRLTPKRKYPIFEEKTIIQRVNLPTGMTEIPGYEYVTIDDEGKRCKVPALYFVPEQRPLIGMENNHQIRNDGPTLTYMDRYSDPGMPTIRR